MLMNKIRKESLCIYLLIYANRFTYTISIFTLPDIFELLIKVVYNIISKMIINKELIVFNFFFLIK